MARKSKDVVKLRGTWFWAWQQNRHAAYLNGVTRNEVAATYMREHSGDLHQTVYMVEAGEPTAHIFTAVEA